MRKYTFEQNFLIAACLSFALITLLPPSFAQTTEDPESDSIWDQVQAWYQYAKDTGEQVPANVAEWARSDIQSIGDWEYMVFNIESDDPEHIQAELNRLGADRWECIWIQPSGKATTYYMKRSVRSYLQHVPLSTILKLVPGSGEGSGSN